MDSRGHCRKPPVEQVLRWMFGPEDMPEGPRLPRFLSVMRERLRGVDEDDFVINCVIMALAMFDIPGSRVSDSDREEMLDWANEVIQTGEPYGLALALATVSPILHRALEHSLKRRVEVNVVIGQRAMELARTVAHLTI